MVVSMVASLMPMVVFAGSFSVYGGFLMLAPERMLLLARCRGTGTVRKDGAYRCERMGRIAATQRGCTSADAVMETHGGMIRTSPRTRCL